MQKKKIVVLVDWFAPGYKAGGPIQSCVNFAFAMKEEFSIHVLTTDTDHGEPDPYEGIPSGRWTNDLDPAIQVFYLKKKGLRPAHLKQQIDAVHGEYVYLNHLFSPLFVVYPLWLKYTGRLKSKIVICPRGALYDSALAVKPWKKTPFLRLFRWMGLHKRVLFHATNEREKQAILRHFPGSSILIADNLPKMNQPAFISCPKQAGTVKCIFIARIVPIKNLLFFLQALASIKTSVELSIVGPVEDKGYWDQCREQIAQLGSGAAEPGSPDGQPGSRITVNYLGPRRNDELMPILEQHHIFVLPTTGENFGHSIFEALLAGRPVLISDQTPWLNLTAQKVGWDLPLQDPAAFAGVIAEVAGWDQARYDEWARAAWQYARNFIGNPELKSQYIKLFA
jgi:glycosyltransferase involved in cell wall biosynthesis